MGTAPLIASSACSDSVESSRPSRSLEGKANIFEIYEIGGLLGSGSFGQVRLCWPIKEDSDRRYAVKVVDTKGAVYAQASSFLSARQEASILKCVHHPHIVELVDVFERERWLFLVMECVQGGELFGALSDPKVHVSEGCIAVVGRQLLQALRHLHEQNIVHRDVKAENLLLLTNPAKTARWHIKLIDFGLATKIEQQPTCLFTLCREQEVPIEELICGTAYYCAPEVWVNDYSPKVDVWAAGVVLYLALYGAFPFYSGDSNTLEARICSPDDLPAFQPVCKKECPGYEVSPEARQTLVALLEKDQENRPTAAQALMQTWLQENKRSGSLALVPRPRLASLASRAAMRANSVSCSGDFLTTLDRPIPVAVRMKAGRAAARPPVEAEKEQNRTAALEALKVQSREVEVYSEPKLKTRKGFTTAVEVMGTSKGLPVFSWMDHDMAHKENMADANATDSDNDEGHVLCTCR